MTKDRLAAELHQELLSLGFQTRFQIDLGNLRSGISQSLRAVLALQDLEDREFKSLVSLGRRFLVSLLCVSNSEEAQPPQGLSVSVSILGMMSLELFRVKNDRSWRSRQLGDRVEMRESLSSNQDCRQSFLGDLPLRNLSRFLVCFLIHRNGFFAMLFLLFINHSELQSCLQRGFIADTIESDKSLAIINSQLADSWIVALGLLFRDAGILLVKLFGELGLEIIFLAMLDEHLPERGVHLPGICILQLLLIDGAEGQCRPNCIPVADIRTLGEVCVDFLVCKLCILEVI
jgi:hypothetical protein